jgi:hypothetical protein
VLSQLEEVVFYIAVIDMPSNWKGAIEKVQSMINQDNEVSVFGGLCALRSFVKKFEFGDREARDFINNIAAFVFPAIEQMLVKIIDQKTEEAIRA